MDPGSRERVVVGPQLGSGYRVSSPELGSPIRVES